MSPAHFVAEAPADACCAHCGREAVLNPDEREAGRYQCPRCLATTPAVLPATFGCPVCGKLLGLSPSERHERRFDCPRCRTAVSIAGGPGLGPMATAVATISPASPELLARAAATRRAAARNDVLLGGFTLTAGLTVSIASLLVGNHVVLAWGAVFFGGAKLARGLARR